MGFWIIQTGGSGGGPGTGGAGTQVYNKNLTAQADGIKRVFTAGEPYKSGTLRVYTDNGLRNYPGFNYTESNPGGGEFDLLEAPPASTKIYVDYEKP